MCVLALALISATTQVASAPAPAQAAAGRSLAVIAKEVLDLEAELEVSGRGRMTGEERYLWSTRLTAALIDEAPANTMRALNDHLARMVEIERHARSREKAGFAPPMAARNAEFMRVEAELWVQRKRMR